MKGKIKNSKTAFTLIELIVVIAVLAIIAAIAVPNLFGMIDKAQISADQATLTNLNKVTLVYKTTKNITAQDIFEGVNTDEERIEVLVNEGLFHEVVKPKYKDTQFLWHTDSQKWLYSLYMISDNTVSRYLFSSMQLSDFIFNTWGGGGGSTWSINENGLFVTGTGNNDMLYMGNAKSEYTLNTNFKLNNNPGQNGGVGIFFETIINKDKQYRDSGYILQFDRGYSEIVIRKRVEGIETTDNIVTRIGNRSTSTIKNTNIPYKTNSDWWESEKELSLSVKESGTPGKKLVTIVLDGEVLISDFEIDSDIEAENNHTGFRAWNGASATISELIVE